MYKKIVSLDKTFDIVVNTQVKIAHVKEPGFHPQHWLLIPDSCQCNPGAAVMTQVPGFLAPPWDLDGGPCCCGHSRSELADLRVLHLSVPLFLSPCLSCSPLPQINKHRNKIFENNVLYLKNLCIILTFYSSLETMTRIFVALYSVSFVQ